MSVFYTQKCYYIKPSFWRFCLSVCLFGRLQRRNVATECPRVKCVFWFVRIELKNSFALGNPVTWSRSSTIFNSIKEPGINSRYLQKLIISTYNKALSCTASSCTDLEDAHLLNGVQIYLRCTFLHIFAPLFNKWELEMHVFDESVHSTK